MHYAKIAITLFTILLTGGAFAEEAPTESARSGVWDRLDTTLTVGIDSIYVLYGYRQTEPLLRGDVWLSLPFSERITLNAGSWYGHLTDGSYREIDVYTGADYALGNSFYIGFLYSYFDYLESPWGDGDAHEIAAHISYWGERISLSLRNHYDNEADGSLTRIIAGYTAPLSDRASLKLDAETGYAFGYYIEGNAWNHAQFKASLPVQTYGRLTLTPFVAYTVPLAAIDAFEEEDTYYGLSAVISF